MLNFINIFSGGSLSRMTIGAFGISSYITASLILQQMTIVFPSLEKTRND
jgi:preprotein translocase subunit SecY